jgi:hypothetical protein
MESSAPQCAQATTSAVPHVGQNLAPTACSAWQTGQDSTMEV